MSDPKEWTTHEFLRMLKDAVKDTERWLCGDDNVIKVQRKDHQMIEVGHEVEPGEQERLLTPNTFENRESKSRKYSNFDRFFESLAKAQNSFEKRVLETANSGDHVCRPVIRSEYKAWHWMFFNDYTNESMINHFHRQDSLLSNQCQEAMQLAPHKMEELDLEGMAGFLTIFHALFFGTNCASFLILFTLLNSKQRLERKMNRGRQRLEQELNDPFLRQSLECRAAVLAENERQQLIARLEAKLMSWDSKAAVSNLLRQHVRRFRLLVLLTFVVTTLLSLIPLLLAASIFGNDNDVDCNDVCLLLGFLWC